MILLFFALSSPESKAVFQVKFYGGTWETPASESSGTLFKTSLSNGTLFRFLGSFSYSQGTESTTNIVQGELVFGISFYPGAFSPKIPLQPFLYLEAGGLMGTKKSEGTTKSTFQKEAFNIGVGFDWNLFKSFGLNFAVEQQKMEQIRFLLGFFQKY
jgi:hypothetical protein